MTASAEPRLVVRDALGRRVVSIGTAPFRIGRRDGNDLQLAGAEVSRDHAEIVSAADGFVLRDRGSRYGTFVNRDRITSHRLAHGDRIQFGRGETMVLFLIGDEAASRDDDAGAAGGELRQVATLLQGLRKMGGDRVLDEVLVLVLDSAIETTGAERGFIMLADRAGTLEMKLARSAKRTTVSAVGFTTSRKIPEDVFASGQMKVVPDLLESEFAAVHTGTVALGIRHVLCAPLRVVRYVERKDARQQRQNIGVLYLDSREKGRLLSPAARAAVEALASEAALAIENARLYQEALEKSRLDQELRTASQIQRALLPDGVHAGAFFEAVAASVPSRSIGGDFFDYQDLPGGALRFGLGDVTGKGPPAALLAALVQGILAASTLGGAAPDEVAAQINQVLLSRRIEARYITVFLGILSPGGDLTYCNAAQNPPLLFSGGSWQRLETGGTLLGAFPAARYERDTLRLQPGDTLVLYSDGISEAENAAGNEFGEDGVRAAIEAVLSRPPHEILSALFDGVRAFAGDDATNDDLTALVLRFSGAV